MIEETQAGQQMQVATPEELTAAREARGLSQVDISQRIKLQVKQVRALEEGDWDALPGRSFVRGALRSYGKLIDVDVSPLLDSVGGFAEPTQVEGITPLDAPISRSSGLGFNGGGRGSPILWVIAGLIGVVALVLYFGSGDDGSGPGSWLRRGGEAPAGSTTTPAPVPPADGSNAADPAPAGPGPAGAWPAGSNPGSPAPGPAGAPTSDAGSLEGSSAGAPASSASSPAAPTPPATDLAATTTPQAGAAPSAQAGTGGPAEPGRSDPAPALAAAEPSAGSSNGGSAPGAVGPQGNGMAGAPAAAGNGAANNVGSNGGSAGNGTAGNGTAGSGTAGNGTAGNPASGGATGSGLANAGLSGTGISGNGNSGTGASPVIASAGPAGVAAEPVAARADAAEGQAAKAPVTAVDSKGLIRLQAGRQDSWIEVRQADGSALHNGLVKAGESLELKGTPPYRLVLGNASHVTLTYEGKPRDLGPHMRANNIARLQLR